MKTKIFLPNPFLIGFACLSFFLFVASAPQSVVDNQTDINIQFGRGPNCTSRGMCSVDEPSGSLQFGGTLVAAQIHIDTQNRPVISINKNDLTVSVKETQFVDGLFQQFETISFPGSLAGQAESAPPISISPGAYTVADLGNRYSITF